VTKVKQSKQTGKQGKQTGSTGAADTSTRVNKRLKISEGDGLNKERSSLTLHSVEVYTYLSTKNNLS